MALVACEAGVEGALIASLGTRIKTLVTPVRSFSHGQLSARSQGSSTAVSPSLTPST
jgi:hypothetical protein